MSLNEPGRYSREFMLQAIERPDTPTPGNYFQTSRPNDRATMHSCRCGAWVLALPF